LSERKFTRQVLVMHGMRSRKTVRHVPNAVGVLFLSPALGARSTAANSTLPATVWLRAGINNAERPKKHDGNNLHPLKLRMVTRLLLTSFAVFLFPYFCFADFSGPVVSVLDGDTIEVLHNTHPERVRLSGIDCPEKGQAYGNNAKHAASELAFGKDVTI
jgi:endonuclease YncB( thermonuclease family)